MKSKLLLFTIILFSALKFYGQVTDTCCCNVLLTSYSEKMYTSEPVTAQQLEFILNCGIKSPSSRNLQPWKFTVIRDDSTMQEVVKDIVPGNVLIVVSGIEKEDGTTPDFDCGLAAQNMFIAAHSLGLGARIYGGPVDNINANKELFRIPPGYKSVVALRIGNTDKNVDAVTAATPRKTPDELINYK